MFDIVILKNKKVAVFWDTVYIYTNKQHLTTYNEHDRLYKKHALPISQQNTTIYHCFTYSV